MHSNFGISIMYDENSANSVSCVFCVLDLYGFGISRYCLADSTSLAVWLNQV